MGTVEAAEKQKVALRLLRALRRTTNILADGEWLTQSATNWQQVASYQNFLGSAYKTVFEGLQYDSNRRRATFTGTLIEDVLKLMTGQQSSIFEIHAADGFSVWNYNADARLLRVNRRVWCIAFEENTQTVRVFEVWYRASTQSGLQILSAQIPKMPQHIGMPSPPANSYFITDFENNLTENGGANFTGINLIKLI